MLLQRILIKHTKLCGILTFICALASKYRKWATHRSSNIFFSCSTRHCNQNCYGIWCKFGTCNTVECVHFECAMHVHSQVMIKYLANFESQCSTFYWNFFFTLCNILRIWLSQVTQFYRLAEWSNVLSLQYGKFVRSSVHSHIRPHMLTITCMRHCTLNQVSNRTCLCSWKHWSTVAVRDSFL